MVALRAGPGEVRAALSGLAHPLLGVFGQQITQRDATASSLGREPLGKITRKDDRAAHGIVALPALVAQLRQALSSPAPGSRHR
jgi:hypothetical protein